MGYIQNNNNQNQWGNKRQEAPQTGNRVERRKGLEYVGVFAGLSLQSQGTRTDKNTGQEVVWQKFKLSFMTGNVGESKQLNFQLFTPVNKGSLGVSDLNIGHEYKVYYNVKEYEHPQHGLIKYKQAYMLLNPKMNENPQNKPLQAFIPKPVTNTYQTNNAVKPQINTVTTQVLPEYKQLWDSNNFSSYNEWMNIACDSNLFDNEDEAKQVWDILSKQ